MKPKYPYTQAFDALPAELPLYLHDNTLLPGGELPLELSKPADLALFFHALKTDQMVGLIQPDASDPEGGIHSVGCAGRIRQYRERKDGRLNVMLTGVCRYQIIEALPEHEGLRIARVDWSNYPQDYETEDVDANKVERFKSTLRKYFERHNMQVDWAVLDEQPIEEVVNNLVLVMYLDNDSKQQLLESPTVTERVTLFTNLLEQKPDPIVASGPESKQVN